MLHWLESNLKKMLQREKLESLEYHLFQSSVFHFILSVCVEI